MLQNYKCKCVYNKLPHRILKKNFSRPISLKSPENVQNHCQLDGTCPAALPTTVAILFAVALYVIALTSIPASRVTPLIADAAVCPTMAVKTLVVSVT